MITDYLLASAIFICGEIFGLTVFPILMHFLGTKGSKAFDALSIFKGVIERLVIFVAMIHGYPHILIAFGAMKLGTRLHDEEENTISNSCFLLGNLISMLIAIVTSIITIKVWEAY